MKTKDISVNIQHRYRLQALGETNQSTTYVAQDLTYGRDVFIKEIFIAAEYRAVAIEKAKEEAKAMVDVGRMTTHVPVVYEYFYDGTQHCFYIVMQKIRGETLDEVFHKKNGGKDVREGRVLLDNLATICDVLELMNRHGYYHKDIKPDNIMRGCENEAYLIDFGSSVNDIGQENDGTVGYRAPEMEKDYKLTNRTRADVFSLGVILYEFFTGRRPEAEVDYKRGSQRGPEAWKSFVEPKEKRPEIPDPINELIVKCMKRNPKDRYDIRGLKQALWKAKRALR